MASSTVQNPPAQTAASKSAKKKKAKATRAESPAPVTSATSEKAASVAANGVAHDESGESPYIRELRKNIRNVNKKITHASKTDSLIADHPNKSLDDLVAAKVINPDQRAQVLKRPAMQAQVAQLEEQLAQYQKVDQEYRARLSTEKAELEKALADKLEKEKAAAVAEVKEKAEANVNKSLHDSLLVLSQFLRLAAARRAEEADAQLDENLALEGVLLNVYSGDENAVTTMMKLVQAAQEQTRSTAGELLQTTFAQVHAAAVAHGAPLFQTEPSVQSAESEIAESKDLPGTDPTIAHAGLSEIDQGAAALTNGHAQEQPQGTIHTTNAGVADGGSNAAGENQWDNGNNDMIMSQEWVDVKIPTEAETAPRAVPAAAAATTQSWADDQPDAPAEAPVASLAPVDANDGYSQVVPRNRGRGDREGGSRGGRGGERGGYRGRGGFRGDGRGRGRGRGGPRAGMRGGMRPSAES